MPNEVWACGQCGKITRYQQFALDCCAPLAIGKYQCSNCYKVFTHMNDARQCEEDHSIPRDMLGDDQC